MQAKYILALLLAATGISLTVQASAPSYKVVHTFQAKGNRGDGAGQASHTALVMGVPDGPSLAGDASDNATGFPAHSATRPEKILCSCKGGADGRTPAADVVEHDGVLHGPKTYDGQPFLNPGDYREDGSIYGLDTATGAKTTHVEHG